MFQRKVLRYRIQSKRRIDLSRFCAVDIRIYNVRLELELFIKVTCNDTYIIGLYRTKYNNIRIFVLA